MNPVYRNKISKIFIKHSLRNCTRFARNLHNVKTSAEDLNSDRYLRMTQTIHSFINVARPKDVQDIFLSGKPKELFSSMFMMKSNITQVSFCTKKLNELKALPQTPAILNDIKGFECYLEYRQSACARIYEDRLVPVLCEIFQYLENNDEINYQPKTRETDFCLRSRD